MDYPLIFDTAMEIGYQLAMSGAETYRIEESINRIMAAYGAKAEVFAIPNSMTATITTPDGESITRLRRIGFHGNDMDTVELYSNLSRQICTEKPAPDVAAKLVQEAATRRRRYTLPMLLVGNVIASIGFCLFFGGTAVDTIVAAACGLVIGIINHLSAKLHINNFFATMVSTFAMALTAYLLGSTGTNADAAIVAAIMALVPGLLFINAIRDIIFGDINSGINRLVHVILIAVAIGLGAAVARSLSISLVGPQPEITAQNYGPIIQCVAAFIGCLGFCILFNIHGIGSLLCALGGTLSWGVYLIAASFTDPVVGYLFGTVFAAFYSEAMARIRHFPAITYLVISVFPLLPGAGIYYTTSFLSDNNMEAFLEKGTETIAIAGLMAIGILIVSTIFRGTSVWKQMRHK
ncbi:MAG: threonine/serine exporter family protein [Ruminococcaceae bacterium]|nr:threonine/serine exporter family protein [Oscillospiraceae bacterium]